MSEFYRKYKNLFLISDSPAKKPPSYLRPLQLQMGGRIQSLNWGKNSQSQVQVNYKSAASNRFEAEILPQINRLNRKNENRRATTEKTQIYFTPQINNKSIKMEREKRAESKPQMSPKLNYQTMKHLSDDHIYTQVAIDPQVEAQNPEDGQAAAQPKERSRLQTEPTYLAERARYWAEVDHSRVDYGYPQVNFGLIFSEYERQNQFQLINNRIKDIRWIEKFHPRGSINTYRESLLRRKDCKVKINDRRHRLRKLLEEEHKEYMKKRSIV